MKVSSAQNSPQSQEGQKSKKLSQKEVRDKIKAKFGDKALEKKEKPVVEDKVEVKGNKGVKNSSEEDFGDIGKNDPSDQLTHDKLKEVLKSGAFHFNDRERATLAKILK